MKNAHRIVDDVVYISVRGTHGVPLETKIDLADLPKVQGITQSITARWDRDTRSYYASFQVKKNGVATLYRLHRFILGTPFGAVVDHKNHDTLDNRRENIRDCTNTVNQLNRARCNRNNRSSGIRGVSFDKQKRKWSAVVSIGGRRTRLGRFTSREDAAQAVASKFKDLGIYTAA